jgi:uncharacterized protein YodC (DUF2158 family)
MGTNMTFAAGDVVFLKSGGEAMTVAAVEDDEVLCLWTGDDGDLFREMIPTVALQTAQSAEEDEDGEEEDSEEEDESEEDEENDEEENAKSNKKKEIA